MDKSEWMRRFIEHMQTQGVGRDAAQSCAEASYQAFVEAGGDYEEQPEEAASCELSYWGS